MFVGDVLEFEDGVGLEKGVYISVLVFFSGFREAFLVVFSICFRVLLGKVGS